MRFGRLTLVSLVVMALAVPPLARADAPRTPSAPKPSPALEATGAGPTGPLLTSALAAGSRVWAQAPQERLAWSTVAQGASASPSKPFWTRTKVLVAIGATLLLAAWLVSEIKESCREQGAACFD